jgi:hypothetical protein
VLQRLHGSAELLRTLKAKFAQDGVSVRLSCCRPSQLLAHRRRCIVAAVASPPLQPAMRSAMRLALADVDERFSGHALVRDAHAILEQVCVRPLTHCMAALRPGAGIPARTPTAGRQTGRL